MIDLAIFDIDGTLFQSHEVGVRAVGMAYAEFTGKAPDYGRILSLFGEPMEKFCAGLLPEGTPDDFRHLLDLITVYEDRMIQAEGRLFPDVPETLARLKESGVRLAICTNGQPEYIDILNRKFHWEPLFETMRSPQKPGEDKAVIVGAIIRDLNARQAAVVGDRRHDFEAAKANGAWAIGAGWGYGPPEELALADRVAAKFSELPDLLLNLPEKKRG